MNSIVAWDALEQTVDHLADVVAGLLDGPEDVVCSLRFAEAEALAEVLDAGRHTDIAARLMHRWAPTEPDWDGPENGKTIRRWLAVDHVNHVAALDCTRVGHDSSMRETSR